MRKERTLRNWVIAARPWSLPASLVPIAATAAYILSYARHAGTECNWPAALMCLAVMVLFHSGANLIGDHSDYMKKVDLPGSPNGVYWIYDGTFTAKEVLRYGIVLIAAACAIGLWLVALTDISLLWLGIAGCALAFLYPWFKAHRLGDMDILLSFAVLPSLGMGLVVTKSCLWQAVAISFTYGLLTLSILQANNTRDILNDSRAGISTLCMWMGVRQSRWLYAAEVVGAFLLTATLVCLGVMPIYSLAVALALPAAITNCRRMLSSDEHGDSINALDQQSAQLQLAFGFILTLSFIVDALL